MDFAARLNWLFENWQDANDRTLRNTEVARGIGEIGFSISNAYIGKLRTGSSKPSWEVVWAFAQFFGVPVTFFYQDYLDEEDLKVFKATSSLRGDEVSLKIATRLPELKPVTKQALLAIIRDIEGENDEE